MNKWLRGKCRVRVGERNGEQNTWCATQYLPAWCWFPVWCAICHGGWCSFPFKDIPDETIPQTEPHLRQEHFLLQSKDGGRKCLWQFYLVVENFLQENVPRKCGQHWSWLHVAYTTSCLPQVTTRGSWMKQSSRGDAYLQSGTWEETLRHDRPAMSGKYSHPFLTVLKTVCLGRTGWFSNWPKLYCGLKQIKNICKYLPLFEFTF